MSLFTNGIYLPKKTLLLMKTHIALLTIFTFMAVNIAFASPLTNNGAQKQNLEANNTNTYQENLANAKQQTFSQNATSTIKEILNNGSIELYFPIHAWHNREAYPKYKIDNYNEDPWGFGLGKYLSESKKVRKGLLIIAFNDSNRHFQPLMLYTWQKTFLYSKNFIRLSLGYMAGFTTRKEWHWLPLPMALPILSAEAGPISYSNTYIPGLGNENGNVWFSWVSIRF